MPEGGLQPGAHVSDDDSDSECVFFLFRSHHKPAHGPPVSDLADKTAKMRRAVRANNFTQQTNALDVDKHMCVVLFFCPAL